MPLEIVPADSEMVLDAARIKMKNNIAYADAFAVATARRKHALLLTGDPERRSLTEVKVHYIGKG